MMRRWGHGRATATVQQQAVFMQQAISPHGLRQQHFEAHLNAGYLACMLLAALQLHVECSPLIYEPVYIMMTRVFAVRCGMRVYTAATTLLITAVSLCRYTLRPGDRLANIGMLAVSLCSCVLILAL